MRQSRQADPGRHPAVPPRAGLALMSAAVVLSTCGCGGSPTSGPAAGTAASGGTQVPGGRAVTVAVRSVPGAGTVLVNGQGYALYVFAPDNHRAVTCIGACAGTWPPLMLPPGSRFAAGAGVKPALLGSDPDPAGGRVVTYDGWPLYTYADDLQPGEAAGQDIDLNGGAWYVIRPSGRPLIPAP